VTLAEIGRLFAYDAWANNEALASLREAEAPAPRAVEIMAHIVAAEWLWLRRLGVDRPPVAVWPDWSLARSTAELAVVQATWPAYLDALSHDDLARPATYVNTAGETWTNAVGDILVHVVTHSAYHRGQIAYALGRAGHKAAYTDFIHAARRGLIE
jgi:uncharacterized damage-inducible protein DinB